MKTISYNLEELSIILINFYTEEEIEHEYDNMKHVLDLDCDSIDNENQGD